MLSVPPGGARGVVGPHSQAGGGSGAIHVMRWSPDGRSWQNSNGSSAEHASSRVAGLIVLPQHPGWRSSDWSWRTRLRSQPLWGMAAWRRLARALWRSGWHLMPPCGGWVSGRAVYPFRRGVASSEAETRGAVEGFDGEPSSEAEITPRVRVGCGWAALCTWAAYWASLSPFLSSELEGGCRPSWARLPNMCLCF